jgi:hypothetical protein
MMCIEYQHRLSNMSLEKDQESTLRWIKKHNHSLLQDRMTVIILL